MKPEALISIASLLIAAGSLAVAIYSSIRSSEIAATQADVQKRMLALESVRQRAETRAQKRANVTGGLRKFGTDLRLVVQNAGPATGPWTRRSAYTPRQSKTSPKGTESTNARISRISAGIN